MIRQDRSTRVAGPARPTIPWRRGGTPLDTGALLRPDVRARLALLVEPATVIMVVAVIVALTHFVVLMTNYRHLFVHPDWHQRILRESLRDGLTISPTILPYSMQLREEGESRPRWLTYLVLALDQKARLWLYDQMPVHPTFAPVAWLLQLVVTPYYLYRFLMNVVRDRAAALAGVAVYLTTNGFLSGFTMQFMPGKTLSNTIAVLALYTASVAVQSLRPGQLIFQAQGMSKYALLMILFIGLFIDEMPITLFVIVPLFYWSAFVPSWRWNWRITDTLKSAAFLATPAIAFIFVVVVVAPPIIASYFGFKFDYLADTLLLGGHQRTGVSLLEGREPLTLRLVMENMTTLFGLSLAPGFISPMITSEHGPFPGSQETNLPKLVILTMFFGVAALVGVRGRGTLAAHVRGLLAGLTLFMFFISALSIRHIPIVTGYYYGALFASLFAILVALLVTGVSQILPPARLVAAVAAACIVGIQIVNFRPVNDGWIFTHNERLTRTMMERQPPGIQKRIPLRQPVDLSAAEVEAIWMAWKNNRLDRYMREHAVSTAAVYEVFELREIDRSRRDR